MITLLTGYIAIKTTYTVLAGVGGAGMIVLGKYIYDSNYSEEKFKFDTVTDIRLKDKAHQEKNYKSKVYGNKTGGIT